MIPRLFAPALSLALVCASCAPSSRDGAASSKAPGGLSGDQVSWPGKRPDGSVLLPNQWALRPVGSQIELADFPINIAVHPSGRFAAILHSGYSQHEILCADLSLTNIVSRTKLPEAFYGIEFSRDGRRLFCSGAGDETIHVFDFAEGQLTNSRAIHLRDAKTKGVPAGLALDAAGKTLWVANVWGGGVSRIDLTAEPARVTEWVIGTNAASPARAAVIPSPDFDTAAAEKRDDALLSSSASAQPFPYSCRLDEKRRRLYVSLWSQSAVAVLNCDSGEALARWPAQEHPCEMALSASGKYLFVANAGRNTVTVFDTDRGKPIETIWAALYPNAPYGSTPNSIALSADGKQLFVANADNNMVAVFDISIPGKSRSLGFVPVGWYPTSVRVTPDGRFLLVANGKGLTSKPNPHGPQPAPRKPGVGTSTSQYIAQLLRGSLSIIPIRPERAFMRKLPEYSAQAYQCSPLKPDTSITGTRTDGNPIPSRPGDGSPIKYCIFIIKENRTYDQVLGDMPQGHGDPSLCIFPERVTPNHHKIAREFVLLDNFYVESEVSADGHEWTMGAYATDFVEKMWPLNYGHNRTGKFPYPSEGGFPIAAPAGGYLWDRAREAGVTYRSYGEFVANPKAPGQPARAKVKALEGHCDPFFQSFDLGYSDIKRAERFISELKRFEGEGEMPRLQIVRLPNDHTHGTTAGFRSPTAYVAENDLAVGMVIEAVSRSKFWPQTAIFMVEDDAQNGPDHIDAHRTTAYVVSPYVRRGAVDSSLYSTSSMLRTMELILGLRPMSQFDAAARPMFHSFQAEANPTPFQALAANVDLDEMNQRTAWGGDLKMNFAREDAADDLLLNEVIWRSVRGSGSPMPAPIRAAFVFPHPRDRDDD